MRQKKRAQVGANHVFLKSLIIQSCQLAERNSTNLPNRFLPTCRTKSCQLADFMLDKRVFDAIVMGRKTTEELDAG